MNFKNVLSGLSDRLNKVFFGRGLGNIAVFRWLYKVFISISSRIPVLSTTPAGTPIYQNLFTIISGPNLNKLFEPSTTELFQREVEPGYTVLDIGANLGYYTSICANIVGDQGHIYAFEPGKQTSKLLARTIAKNNFTNVTVVPKAVSNTAGETPFFDHGAQSTVSYQPYAHLSSSGTVETIVLDDFLPADTKVDYIKMDIEGHEATAMRGMRRILSENSAKLIFEFCPYYLSKAGGDSAEVMLRQLMDYGYHFYDGKKEDYQAEISLDEILEIYTVENKRCTNLFCKKS